MEIEFTDRYQALGIPRPNPKTVCKGGCEGTGWIPVKAGDKRMTTEMRRRWIEAEKESPSDDGWHFIKCPTCEGTGKK
jgi:hypothetical protein